MQKHAPARRHRRLAELGGGRERDPEDWPSEIVDFRDAGADQAVFNPPPDRKGEGKRSSPRHAKRNRSDVAT
jgi:hypothetical protein